MRPKCRNCRHCEPNKNSLFTKHKWIDATCEHPEAEREEETHNPQYHLGQDDTYTLHLPCDVMRRANGACGPDARLYSPTITGMTRDLWGRLCG